MKNQITKLQTIFIAKILNREFTIPKQRPSSVFKIIVDGEYTFSFWINGKSLNLFEQWSATNEQFMNLQMNETQKEAIFKVIMNVLDERAEQRKVEETERKIARFNELKAELNL